MLWLIVWFAATVLAAISAVTLFPSQGLVDKMAPILMAAMAVTYLACGLILIAKPSAFRDLMPRFSRPKTVRILGVITMLIGAALFRAASHTDLPLFAQIFGVLAFIEGGVQLLLPSVMITTMEWLHEWSNTAYRALGVLTLVLAALFLAGVGYFNLGGATDPQSDSNDTAVEAPGAPEDGDAEAPAAPAPPAPDTAAS